MKKYDPKKIEKKWQAEWEKSKIYNAKSSSKKKKFYSLIEFPYPSGEGLHVGHIRSNTAMDIVSRKRRMEGHNVLYPIGWDAFGLPTENYAIKTGKKPAQVTKENTDTFRRQLKELGFSFDWSREINTTDPKYYKWTQWIFLQFLKKGLAYKAKSEINWCLSCKIGLANEEVVEGKCERCGGDTEKREKEQWMLAITKYADRLDKDLDLVNYPDRVKTQQRNWIGKSEGSEISFQLIADSEDVDPKLKAKSQKLSAVSVFTTRADTLFGATYLVLAPEHPLIENLKLKIENYDEVAKYINKTKKKSEIERTAEGQAKTGVEIKGVKAVNPATGEEVPIWIADYVLAQYGTGAIMAVPAHDERDFAFAEKYNIPVVNVVERLYVDNPKEELAFKERNAVSVIVKHWSEDKYIGLKWKKVNWGTFITGGIEEGKTAEEAAVMEIKEETGYLNPKLVETLPNSHSKFYHEPKGENRFAHFSNLYFELDNGEKVDISAEENAKHDLVWLSKEEVEKFITPEGQLNDWRILNGEEKVFSGYGILVNSGEYTGMESKEAAKKITEFVGGKVVTKFKLRDWVFSRQRYWGEPIPVINCGGPARMDGSPGGCGLVPVPEKDLPVELPDVKSYTPTDTGESPLAAISKWVNVKCPKCKGEAKRETDTMPNWAGSSWYYLRYIDTKNDKAFASPKSLYYWSGIDPLKAKSNKLKAGPVDWYNGGMEHTTLHLLYSRFWHKFLYDLKLVPTIEPYNKRTSHGMILAEGGAKMSKSKPETIINPGDIVKVYGADTLRVYEMFMGPFEDSVAWSTESIIGSRRFLEKVWRIGEKALGSRQLGESDKEVRKTLHKTIKKVSEDIENMRFNTAISAMMILSTEMEKVDKLSAKSYKLFLRILAPFAPFMTEELWASLGEKKSIHLAPWPEYDESLSKDDEVKIGVQVNGKVRAEILIEMNEDEESVKKKALELEEIKKYLTGDIKRIIFVKNRLINILV